MRCLAPPPLRAARVADADLLTTLQGDAFDRPWTTPALARALEDYAGFALIVGAPNAEGFVLGRCVAEHAEILILVVQPSARRRGYGRALLQAAAGEAAMRGAAALFLEVAVDNDGAHALYLSAGFREIGRRRGYYQRPGGRVMDARSMRLDL